MDLKPECTCNHLSPFPLMTKEELFCLSFGSQLFLPSDKSYSICYPLSLLCDFSFYSILPIKIKTCLSLYHLKSTSPNPTSYHFLLDFCPS